MVAETRASSTVRMAIRDRWESVVERIAACELWKISLQVE